MSSFDCLRAPRQQSPCPGWAAAALRDPGQPGVGKARELHHDSHVFAAYRLTEARLRDQYDGAAEVRRVVLEEDLKREYQAFLQDHNRDRSA